MNKNFFILFSFVCLCMSIHTSHANDDIFQHVILNKEPTRYIISEKKGDFVEIKAFGQESASALFSDQPLLFTSHYPVFRWEWKVDQIQRNADLTIKDQEDFAASVHFVFGENSLMKKPKVLIYAWVGNDTPVGTLIKSPRAPNNFRTIIVKNAQSPLGEWQVIERNIAEDFKRAYGEGHDKDLSALGILTDNDQTMESVTAHYRLSYFEAK